MLTTFAMSSTSIGSTELIVSTQNRTPVNTSNKTSDIKGINVEQHHDHIYKSQCEHVISTLKQTHICTLHK